LNPVASSKPRLIILRVLLNALFVLQLFDHSSLAQSSPPAADTFVSSSFAKTNVGSSVASVVQNGATTYVQFNLSGVPADATVTKASLRLFVDAAASSGKFDIYGVTSNWSENSVTHTPGRHWEIPCPRTARSRIQIPA
jgi:hypothetical protein